MANLACRTMCNSKPAILESGPQIFTQSDFNVSGGFHVEWVHRLGGGGGMGGAFIILALLAVFWWVSRKWRHALENIRREASAPNYPKFYRLFLTKSVFLSSKL